MCKKIKTNSQFHLRQQLTHKMCVRMGMIPNSLHMCWGCSEWRTSTMSTHSLSGTSGRDTHLSRRRREQREGFNDYLMGQHALLLNPNVTKRTWKKRGSFSVSRWETNTKIPQSPKMIHTLSLKMTMLEWLTQKTWSRTKDCAKQKKRKIFLK